MSDKSYMDNTDQSGAGQKGERPSANGAEPVPAAGFGSDAVNSGSSGKGEISLIGWEKEPGRSRTARKNRPGQGSATPGRGRAVRSRTVSVAGTGASVDKTGSRNASRTGSRAVSGGTGSRPRATAKRGTGKGKGVPSHRRRFRRKLRRFLPVILAGIIAVFLLFLIISGVRAVVRRIIPDRTPPVIELTRKADYFVDSAEEYVTGTET